ncbi:hypothetical protein GF374_02520 [Candidatus Woesearchaeota archaeon]|nr:hypothetical protein [Candidatus Woesearchaeota archaeon]
MKGHTHLLLAVLFGVLYFDYFIGGTTFWMKIGFAAMLIVGALLPDIDQEESSASHKSPWLSALVRSFSKHRGIMHSIWIPIIIFLIAKFLIVKYFHLPDLILMGFLIGYTSHLAGDAITKKGIVPLSPFSKFRIRGLMKTGGLAETIVGILIISFIIVH